MENWEAFPFFFGEAGTGKSQCLKIISKFYDSNAVGALASKQDGCFQLEGFLNKDVILATEAGKKLEVAIAEEDLKCMVSGERVTVNRKGRTPQVVEAWTAPIAFASNHLPNFSKENVASIGRRLVPILFSQIVPEGDPHLERKLDQELPNICSRFLTTYRGLCEEFGDCDIMKHLPSQMSEWAGDVRAAQSKLY
eukprot:scaffold83541_cov25-Prasinocladus_malaysianus.AAC.1